MNLNPNRLRINELTNVARHIGRKIKTKDLFALNRFTSVVLLVALLPVTMTSMPKATAEKDQSGVSIKLALDSPNVLASGVQISEIKPGESLIQKEARIKAEEEAKRQAEAQKAKALEDSRKRNTVSREKRVYSDPSNFDEIYNRAGSAYGVDPKILRAVHTVETGASGSTSRTSYAGAQGPMQFLPSTWKRHAVDGNGDGSKDINNVEDAIFTAAAYLKACGYPNVKQALWGYNPSMSYYNKVMGVARSLGF